ncbi:hypothetical protein BMS3Abin07_01330 [bacterium BMS3Abin07]|nr:hypothetical protein BMS3Abin07_01330 [bacterium BMS3Abin07]
MNIKSSYIICVFLVFIMFSHASISEGAESELKSSVVVSEEYTDNIFLADKDKKDDYITRVRPNITFDYNSPLWQWNLSYTLDYRIYAKNSKQEDPTHILNGMTNIALIKNFFFVKVKDDYRRVSLSATRDYTKESLFVNQSDRNKLDLNPYFLIALDPAVKLTTGYIYSNIWYKEKNGIDKTDNIGYVALDVDLSRKIVLTPGYRYIQENSGVDAQDFNAQDIFLGARYEYWEKSNIYFKVGYGQVDFKEKDTYRAMYWDAGITHTLNTTRISLKTGRSYDENPTGNPLVKDSYRLSIADERKRTTISLSAFLSRYTDTVTKDLTNVTYGTSGYIRYALTPRLSGKIDGTFDRYERKLKDTYTRRYIAGLRFDYTILENFSLALAYRYTDSYSPGISGDNYRSNRATVEIKKVF